jgi:hypothetical protein
MHGTLERRLFDAGPVQWAGTLIAAQFLIGWDWKAWSQQLLQAVL